jgi:hypothetical protein
MLRFALSDGKELEHKAVGTIDFVKDTQAYVS